MKDCTSRNSSKRDVCCREIEIEKFWSKGRKKKKMIFVRVSRRESYIIGRIGTTINISGYDMLTKI